MPRSQSITINAIMAASNLFVPYRAAGLVCHGQQMCLQALGTENFFITSIGKAFQVYRTDHLTLSLVSRPGNHEITHVAAHKEITFAASVDGITIWDRARAVVTLRWVSKSSSSEASTLDDDAPVDVLSLLVIGDFLFSLHSSDVIRVWNWKSAVSLESTGDDALVSTVKLRAGSGATCFIHPPTYLNKVAVGTRTGSVHIVNVRTGDLVYECQLCPGVAITCLTTSSVVDVVAAGCADGRVLVHNLKLDERVAEFSHAVSGDVSDGGAEGEGAGALRGAGSTGASVTALSFSVDTTLGSPTLASATESGAIALWNLRTRALTHVLPAAHDGPVLFLSFLPRQPLLLSAGADNSVRMLAIDRLEGVPKLLRSRSGHQAPPRLIRYYGGASVGSLGTGADAAACEIVSAGSDRALRLFHTALPRQDVELSQGKLGARARELGVHPSTLRLPPIVAMAACDRRRGQWADVVTCHAGIGRVYCWSWEAKRLEERLLVLPDQARESAVSVAITACGNFAIVGGTAGTVCLFNLQSGARRGVFPSDINVASSFGAKGKKRSKGGLHATVQEDGREADLGPVDRDVGKGSGPKDGLRQVDSIDTTLLKGIGMLPPKLRALQAAAAAEESGTAPVPSLKHTAAVHGVGSDALNKSVISADTDGRVVWWDLNSHALVGELALPSGVTALVACRDVGLAALPCDDFSVRVVDMATRRLVRTFTGHSNRVTDVGFSADGRWLASASLDRSVRVWDLPTARCIDWVTFGSPVVSLAWSPTGEFLATAHADSPALCLWASRAHFGAVPTESAPTQPVHMDMPRLGQAEGEEEVEEEGAPLPMKGGKRSRGGGKPTTSVLGAEELDGAEDGLEEAGDSIAGAGQDASHDAEAGVVQPKAGCAITLSGKPDAAWVNLPRLDEIQRRNKPRAPPTKPAVVPFFLPTTGGLAPTFAAPLSAPSFAPTQVGKDDNEGWAGPTSGDREVGEGADVRSRIIEGSMSGAGGREARSALAHLLRQLETSVMASGNATSDHARDAAHSAVREHLFASAPAVVDIEVRTLALGGPSVDPAGCSLLVTFLRYCSHELRAVGAVGYELTNAHAGLILAAYQNVLADAVAVAVEEESAAEPERGGAMEEDLDVGARAAVPTTLDARLRAAVTELKAAQAPAAVRVRDLVDKALCMVTMYLGQ